MEGEAGNVHLEKEGVGYNGKTHLWGRDHLAFFFFLFCIILKGNLGNYFLIFIFKNFSDFGVLLKCRQNHLSLAISEEVYLSVTDNFIQ